MVPQKTQLVVQQQPDYRHFMDGRPTGRVRNDWHKFKRRLKRLLMNTEDGHQQRIAEFLDEAGEGVDRSTVSKWMNPDDPATPKLTQMMVILRRWPDVRLDYLIGREEAESEDEKFIEKKVREDGG